MQNVLVVFNNRSGKGIKRNSKKLIFNKFKSIPCKFKFVNLSYIENILNFDKYDTIIVVGGDGSLLKILPLIAKSDKNLGIIPCGTANLFAASLGISGNIKKALETIISGNTMKVDLGLAGNTYFSLRIGTGYDAEIINSSTAKLKQKFGYLAYLISGIKKCFKLSLKDYRLQIDEKNMELKANSIIVANAGNMFKNFFTIAPNGSINDGQLDIFILKTRNFFDFAIIFFQILFNQHENNSRVIYNQAKSIQIQTLEKNFHIDGETVAELPINIRIVPKAINVLVPE